MRWCASILDAVSAHGPGGFAVVFPSYRPDLGEELCLALGLAHIDFRKERMAPLGMRAHTLGLGAIVEAATARANDRGVLLQNAEALLATRPSEARRAFLSAFIRAPRENVAILPLALFGADVADHPNVIRLAATDLPEETMLRQLASMRFQ